MTVIPGENDTPAGGFTQRQLEQLRELLRSEVYGMVKRLQNGVSGKTAPEPRRPV